MIQSWPWRRGRGVLARAALLALFTQLGVEVNRLLVRLIFKRNRINIFHFLLVTEKNWKAEHLHKYKQEASEYAPLF